LKIAMMVILAASISGCAISGSGSRVLEPINDYKWSKAREAIMPNGEVKLIQCLTIEDKKRLDEWINGLEKANNALSGR